jgi:hypothetical protein
LVTCSKESDIYAAGVPEEGSTMEKQEIAKENDQITKFSDHYIPLV